MIQCFDFPYYIKQIIGSKNPWQKCRMEKLPDVGVLFTKQSLSEMARIECEERTNLYVFDIPIPVAVTMVVIWLWICATVFCNLDKHWTLLEAFYFFFISLRLIGYQL
uniref:G_PROTEIN_RECEP_F2_4 domain-containing protein n=1 Tax=Ascaris lumbricoides TaxID=6252 RepID=A0A0M3HIS7_ASCLU